MTVASENLPAEVEAVAPRSSESASEAEPLGKEAIRDAEKFGGRIKAVGSPGSATSTRLSGSQSSPSQANGSEVSSSPPMQSLDQFSSSSICDAKRPSSAGVSVADQRAEPLDVSNPQAVVEALASKDRIIAAKSADIAELTQLLMKKDFEISALRKHIQALERKGTSGGAPCVQIPLPKAFEASSRLSPNSQRPSTQSSSESNDGSFRSASTARSRRMAQRDALSMRQRQAISTLSATTSAMTCSVRLRMEERMKRRGVMARVPEEGEASRLEKDRGAAAAESKPSEGSTAATATPSDASGAKAEESSGVWSFFGWGSGTQESEGEEHFNVWGEDDNSEEERKRQAEFIRQKELAAEREKAAEAKLRLTMRRAKKSAKSPAAGLRARATSNMSSRSGATDLSSGPAVSPEPVERAESAGAEFPKRRLSIVTLGNVGMAATRFRPQWKKPPVAPPVDKE